MQIMCYPYLLMYTPPTNDHFVQNSKGVMNISVAVQGVGGVNKPFPGGPFVDVRGDRKPGEKCQS